MASSERQQRTDTADSEHDLPTSPDALLSYLDDLNITYKVYEHEAVFTVDESDKVNAGIPGMHCRNLFLRDKKKNMFLIVAQNETAVDLKKLSGLIESGRLSFGSAQRLWENLGVKPGSVCPFAIMNDTDKNVRIILDHTMMDAAMVNYHPMQNTMTISLKPHDLVKFIKDTGHEAEITDLSPAAPDE